MEEKHFIETLIPDVMKSLDQIKASLQIGAAQPAGSIPTFADRNLQPPSQFYVTQDFQVRVRSVTSQTNEVVTLTVNMLIENRVVPVSMSSLPFTNALNTITLRIPVTGFLLSASLRVVVATIRAQTYAVVELLDQNGTFQNMLFGGYVTNSMPRSYPPIFLEDSFGGLGAFVGTGYAFGPLGLGDIICPANRIYKIHSTDIWFATGAVPANRYLILAFQTAAGVEKYRWYHQTALPANSLGRWMLGPTLNYHALAGILGLATPLEEMDTIPEFIMRPGDDFYVDVANAQVGDALNTFTVIVEEWLTL